jgi:uncharacterized membrane protein SirB2
MPDHATLKLCHVALAALSGALFVARGSVSLARPAWRPTGPLHAIPHGVDTLLLAVGLLLAWHLGSAATRGWLGAKLVAVVIYIALGAVAMSRRHASRVRAVAFALACATFAFIASVAVTRSPAGFLYLT